MGTQPEARISAKIIKALKMLPDCNAEKRKGDVFGVATLDISGSIDGFAFEIEVKQPGQVPRPRQEARMKYLAMKKVITGWTTNVEDAVKLIMDGYNARVDELKKRFANGG